MLRGLVGSGSQCATIQESTKGTDPMTNLNQLAQTYAAAVAAYKAAEIAKKEASRAIAQFMAENGMKTETTESGKVTLCSGRRTVKVTCKALEAEIKLMKERAVRTGRAVETIGEAYVTIR